MIFKGVCDIVSLSFSFIFSLNGASFALGKRRGEAPDSPFAAPSFGTLSRDGVVFSFRLIRGAPSGNLRKITKICEKFPEKASERRAKTTQRRARQERDAISLAKPRPRRVAFNARRRLRLESADRFRKDRRARPARAKSRRSAPRRLPPSSTRASPPQTPRCTSTPYHTVD